MFFEGPIRKIGDLFSFSFMLMYICLAAFVIMSLFLLPDQIYTQRDQMEEIRTDLLGIHEDINKLSINSMLNTNAIHEVRMDQLEMFGSCRVRCD